MKKMIFVISCLISFIPLVSAESNRLYFTEDKKGLVYDTDYFDEKIFMHHDDMYPNKSYRDVLDIENGTDNECKLYFKIVQPEQDELAKELNITSKDLIEKFAEISALSTEYDTVKNLISKSIEKTFAMFQN